MTIFDVVIVDSYNIYRYITIIIKILECVYNKKKKTDSVSSMFYDLYREIRIESFGYGES